MVNSIIPEDALDIMAYCVLARANPPAILKNAYGDNIKVSSFYIISLISEYDNTAYIQTQDLTEAGISVTPYGLVIIPETWTMTQPTFEVPVKCCGKDGTLEIDATFINSLMSVGGGIGMLTTIDLE